MPISPKRSSGKAMTLMYDVVAHLPHRGLEAWKWTDLKSVVESGDPAGLTTPMTAELTVPEGLTVGSSDVSDGLDAMTKMAAILSETSSRIVVPDGVQFDAPLVLNSLSQGHAQIVIEIGKGASLRVEERHAIADGFSNLDLRYILREGAHLTRSVVTNDGEGAIRNVRAQVTLWEQADYQQVQLTFGSAMTRLETRIACMGQANIDLSGAYLLRESRHADMTHYIDFATPGTTVRDSVAGVATDKARAVFQGKFHVRRPAQNTDAEMRHDALLLSDRARINAKPELEIYADDVECAHGNTIGQLDEQALFYMRQRGIPLDQARALLIEAFIAARLRGDEAMVALVNAWLERRN